MTPAHLGCFPSQGYQVSLKSTRGAIDVFLCPDDNAGVCSPVTGVSPSKVEVEPASTPPRAPAPPANHSPDPRLASPASTLSTVTATSQQEASPLVLPSDSGEALRFFFQGFPKFRFLVRYLSFAHFYR